MILCIMSCLLCEPVSLRVTQAAYETFYKVLYHHIVHVISLCNIWMKLNFRQITRVVLTWQQLLQCFESYYLLCMTLRHIWWRSYTNDDRIMCVAMTLTHDSRTHVWLSFALAAGFAKKITVLVTSIKIRYELYVNTIQWCSWNLVTDGGSWLLEK